MISKWPGPLALLASAALLAACGGGGGGGAPETRQSTAQPTLDQAATAAAVGAPCDITRSTATTATVAATHPRILLNHAQTVTCLQQQLGASAQAATRFKAYVDRELANPGSNWEFQYWWAALMGQVTGSTTYTDFAIAKIDAFVAGEEQRIAEGKAATVAGDSYLQIGRLVGDVALVYDWGHARLTPAQRTRWINYMNQAVWNVWNHTQAKWGDKTFPWTGWSVNNPANNYYYSFLRATMLVGLATHGENPSAAGWLTQFRTNKLGNQLFPTFTQQLEGGGSREGTGYGTAMKDLFQLYDWWERSTGERIASATPHTLASQSWLIHNIAPTLDFLAHTGDQARESTGALFDYHRQYLLTLMNLFPQERISGSAKALLDASSVPKMANGFQLYVDFLYPPATNLPVAPLSELPVAYYGKGTGQFLMRNDWSKTSVYARLACGPYTESHAQRDQGSFLIYKGEWLAPSGHTFTASGIEQQEEMHNLVRVQQGGVTIKQKVESAPCKPYFLDDNELYAYGSVDVTPVYGGQPAISSVQREFLLIKPSTFVVFDRVTAAAGTSRIWTLNLPGAPTVNGDHLSYTGGKSNRLDVYRVAPAGLSYQVNTPQLLLPNARLINPNAKRIDVAHSAGTQSVFMHVMGTNASVASVTKLTSTAPETGARIVLADGRTIDLFLSNNAYGGRMEIINPVSDPNAATSSRARAASVGGTKTINLVPPTSSTALLRGGDPAMGQ